MRLLKNFLADEQGQDMIEYALLLVFVALVCAAAFAPVAQEVSKVWSKVGTSLSSTS